MQVRPCPAAPSTHRQWSVPLLGRQPIARPIRILLVLLLLFLLGPAQPAEALDPPVLVTNIQTGIGPVQSSNPNRLATIGAWTYFAAFTDDVGMELWKTNGTAEGTVLVKDIFPGSGSSSPADFTEFNGVVYFTAVDPDRGRELWRSDGTAAGTQLVKDIAPGPNSGLATVDGEPVPIVPGDGVVFFVATDTQHGFELWKTDGTEGGTTLVADIVPGEVGSQPRGLTWIQTARTLVFSAADSEGGVELWESDGTAAGTRRVADIAPGVASSNPRALTRAGRSLFFTANDGTTGRELWMLSLPIADLSVSASATPPQFTTGQPVNLAVSVANKGAALAASVQLTATLSGNLPVNVSAIDQGTCSGSGPLTCSIGDLGPARR